MIGPMTLAIAQVAPMKPAYFPRSSKETISLMTICVNPIILPAPMPCTARAIMSQTIAKSKLLSGKQVLWAAPHKADPIRKITIEPYRIGFLPKMSLVRPYNGVKAAEARR